MPTDGEASDALPRLRRAFAGLVALERLSRALEGLVIGASCAWVLTGIARLESKTAAQAALVPAAVTGLLAGASWVIERWRDRRAIAARADRLLATPQLLDTALEAPRSAPPDWNELLARRALARFDRKRLSSAVAPAWAATAALVLLAAGAHEWLGSRAQTSPTPTPLAGAWSALAEALESGTPPGNTPAASALAAELRHAAALEARGELDSDTARALLEQAAQGFAPITPTSSASGASKAALAELGKVYTDPGAGSKPGAGAGVAATPASGGGSSVPSGVGDGTMGGSTEGGSARLPAPPGSAGGGAAGAVRPTLSARWWPHEQDGLVEAWIEREQRTRSKR